MTGEFEKQLKPMDLGNDSGKEILRIISASGEEFPCLSCPSKDEYSAL